jgi:hypothetical protein
MNTVLSFLVRGLLLAIGLVFAAGLAVIFLFLMLGAGLHRAWARVRGRPVTSHFVFRLDPRAGSERFYRAGTRTAASANPRSRSLEGARHDVTDVEARPPGDAS